MTSGVSEKENDGAAPLSLSLTECRIIVRTLYVAGLTRLRKASMGRDPHDFPLTVVARPAYPSPFTPVSGSRGRGDVDFSVTRTPLHTLPETPATRMGA